MKEIQGNLITLAREGYFDVIGHGANCFCTMRSGIAPQMAEAFGCDRFKLEHEDTMGDINKLGQIDFVTSLYLKNGMKLSNLLTTTKPEGSFILTVVNLYTQYKYNAKLKPLDYEALTLCMRKINHTFRGKHVALPKIGAGLAGGDWNRIKTIIETEIKDCPVTIVTLP